LRIARTRSLPRDPVGGAQSSVPNTSADGEDAAPPKLLNAAGCLRSGDSQGGAQSSAPAIFPDREDTVPPDLANGLGCLRFGDSPGGARSPVPVHAAAQAALESRRPWRLKILGRDRPPGGAQSSAPDVLADRGDAAPPMGPCGRGTVPCARSCGDSRRPRESPSSTNEKIWGRTPAGRGAVLCARNC